LKSDPATEIDEIVSGAFPDDFSVTMLVAVCPTGTDPNDTLVLLSVSDGLPAFNWMLKIFVEPFEVPVMLAVCAVPTAATAAEKLAEDAPAWIVTDAGTDTAALLLLNAIDTPPLGAAAFKVTEHAFVSAPMTVESLHVKPLKTGATPSPLMLIMAAPCVELLAIATVPVNKLTWSA